ncbi:2-succinyl-5-enolpyruvyl-6-hydroxy-3-cyclohexene-1-carboxylate synthase [Scytonema hofmannii PCC 7110]|uniref:2-succinyl-5-enolpyruvyl-6-hydroxy-3-cyclohexene-1-carboxylate synthase n=1 Tax=Scytonema hofmannii PCC 7110 TaxID=128403 RepID=A0A139XGT3_9CYAN|nr:2-succinyl-5-enolpyruvyl-6-hydroxy-3-cyclohexene-1-carboxylic-acid synthase [Scytonema hofmannii]KYC43904.1 2-succinyl-5-enolpyruvyl-6-hydroxy-3-cyclohexene-1-carboxylate synthase [Scytonema hofmannii PCC 7110]
MTIDFRNMNSVWASIFAETLKQLGLACVVICPGSRSTPLAVAFAQQSPNLEVISILDERSAAFFALGRAKATGLPAALVCTSGTAGANFYPAVIEAKESCIPLLLLTADRPPELRNCHSGQTVDQLKLYGTYPNWQAELAIPSPDMGMLAYLRQTIIYAWEKTLHPVPGSVHLNVPFRDPLAPLSEVETSHAASLQFLQSQFPPEHFFSHIPIQSPALETTYRPHSQYYSHKQKLEPRFLEETGVLTPQLSYPLQYCPHSFLLNEWLNSSQGIIIAGVAQPQQPREYCHAIAHLSQTLKFPVLAEGLSPVRNHANLNPNIISTYDLILRDRSLAKQLAPKIAIQIGEMPTSKELRNWLTDTQGQTWVIDPSDRNLDPLHGRTNHLRVSVEELGRWEERGGEGERGRGGNSSYLEMWLTAEAKVRANIDQTFAKMEELFEGKTSWLLSQALPPKTPIFIANSMPVRDVEFFWQPNSLGLQPFFNRGANGIDGTLSTALGIAHRHQSSVMLTGDLALLHDTNGFLIRNKFIGHLTIVLINNNGGGIFEMLPIAQFEPPFEEFFATPQDIDFAQLCSTYGIEHELISSWKQLQEKFNPLPTQGIRVLELRTNRKADAKWRKENMGKFLVSGV